MKQLIYNFTNEELRKKIKELGEPAYRADQVIDSIYTNRVDTFASINNLPKSLREKLDTYFEIKPFIIKDISISDDGTQKFLFELRDGALIESVVIPEHEKRNTLCLSTQAGCTLNCTFCATGHLPYKRNLEAGEIVAQFLEVEKLTEKKITNIVYMGMGEPFLNYDNVLKSLLILTDGKTKQIAKKRITVSTVGILPEIKKFTEDYPGVKLALSLHATTDEQREKIIPIAKTWGIKKILSELENYYRKHRDPITYEYILFKDFNNSDSDVNRLAKICRAFPSKVNIIAYHRTKNSYDEINLVPADNQEIETFAFKLRNTGTNVFVRNSSGKDINAACGQLALINSENL